MRDERCNQETETTMIKIRILSASTPMLFAPSFLMVVRLKSQALYREGNTDDGQAIMRSRILFQFRPDMFIPRLSSGFAVHVCDIIKQEFVAGRDN